MGKQCSYLRSLIFIATYILFKYENRRGDRLVFLKQLTQSRFITITYYQEGALKTSKGLVCQLDPFDQTLYLKDEQERNFSIHLSSIKEIH